MKKYLYIYSDSSKNEVNEKEVIHSSSELKKSTIHKEADGRKFLTIYTLLENYDGEYVKDKFVKSICIN